MVFSIFSVVSVLLFAVFSQLGHGRFEVLSASRGIFLALAYFVLPVAISVSIATNRSTSRALIIAFFFAVTYELISWLEKLPISPNQKSYAVAAAAFPVIAVVFWLYLSPRIRLYYELISGTEISHDLQDFVEELGSATRFEARFAKISSAVAPYFEAAVVVLILAAFVFAVGQSGHK